MLLLSYLVFLMIIEVGINIHITINKELFNIKVNKFETSI